MFKTLLAGTALSLAVAGAAVAQSASTVGAGSSSGGSATVGSGGSAAAGGTSASTIGAGGSSTGAGGTSSTLGTAGSAATNEGRATSDSKVHGGADNMHGMSKAKAQDGGTWSKSKTQTKIKDDQLTSRTKSMSHEPGGAPAKSTTRTTVPTR
jgi:hypothetical protein